MMDEELRVCEACGENFGELFSLFLLDENGEGFWVCQQCEDDAELDFLLGIDNLEAERE